MLIFDFGSLFWQMGILASLCGVKVSCYPVVLGHLLMKNDGWGWSNRIVVWEGSSLKLWVNGFAQWIFGSKTNYFKRYR